MPISFGFKPLPCRIVEKALLRLGFIERPQKGSSHRQFIKQDKEIFRKVTLDCHKGEVSAMNIKSIIKQAGISKQEFYKAASM